MGEVSAVKGISDEMIQPGVGVVEGGAGGGDVGTIKEEALSKREQCGHPEGRGMLSCGRH
jgi:hypothetical protein